jgi:hypothetical protein
MSICQIEERRAGRPYPRTCPTCRLGPCQRGHWKGTKPPASTPEPVARAALPDVDELAQIIRAVDGDNTLGAGALAEAIIAKAQEGGE